MIFREESGKDEDRMRRLRLGTMLGAAALALSAFPAAAQDVSGRYYVAGRNLDGTNYAGTAQIAQTSGKGCRIVWQVGGEAHGWCMRRGNILAAGYVIGRLVGLIVYEIKNDGSLEGTWTIVDQPGVGLEILQPYF